MLLDDLRADVEDRCVSWNSLGEAKEWPRNRGNLQNEMSVMAWALYQDVLTHGAWRPCALHTPFGRSPPNHEANSSSKKVMVWYGTVRSIRVTYVRYYFVLVRYGTILRSSAL